MLTCKDVDTQGAVAYMNNLSCDFLFLTEFMLIKASIIHSLEIIGVIMLI